MPKIPPAVGKKPEGLRGDEKPKPKPGPKPLPKPGALSPAKPVVAIKPGHLKGDQQPVLGREQSVAPLTSPPRVSQPTTAALSPSPKSMPPPVTPIARAVTPIDVPKEALLKPAPPPSRGNSPVRASLGPEPSTPRAVSPAPLSISASRSPAPAPPRSRDVSRDMPRTAKEREELGPPLPQRPELVTRRSTGPPPPTSRKSDTPPPAPEMIHREAALPPSRMVSREMSLTPEPAVRGREVSREGAIAPSGSRVPSIIEPPITLAKSRDVSVGSVQSDVSSNFSSRNVSSSSYNPPPPVAPKPREFSSSSPALVPTPRPREVSHSSQLSTQSTYEPPPPPGMPGVREVSLPSISYNPPTPTQPSSEALPVPAAPEKPRLPDPASFAAPPVHHAVAAAREREKEQQEAPPLPQRRGTAPCLGAAPFPGTGTRSPNRSDRPERPPRHSVPHVSVPVPTAVAVTEPYEPQAPPRRNTMNLTDAGETESEVMPSAAIDGYQDYPDSTNVNRKPPILPGRSQLSLKHDVKVCDSNDHFIVACSLQHTFVLSAEHMDLLWSIPHNDIKVSTVKVIGDEYAVIGSKEGSLWELHLSREDISIKRNTAHTTPIVLIHKAPSGLYTLSEDGKVNVWPHSDSPLCATPRAYKLSFGFIRQAVGVDNTIWVGKSRNAFVFREDMNFVNPHIISSTVPGNRPSLDFSCVCADGGNVYFGHENGNVTVFSVENPRVVAQQFVNSSCPQALYCREDQLWTGFKNGDIQILDVSSVPWKIIKSFDAHNSGVFGLCGGRTTVTSYGMSSNLRFWDAQLCEYWIDQQLVERQDDYCTYSDLTVGIISWNCGAVKPSQLHRASKTDRYWIESAIEDAKHPDVLAFGFQELVELSDKGLSAKAFMGRKKDDISDQYMLWEEQLLDAVGPDYAFVKTDYMVGLFSCLFVRKGLKVSNVASASVKTGLGGLHGNKGAVCIRFVAGDSSLCFTNVHLAAGQSGVLNRTKDLQTIFGAKLFKDDGMTDYNRYINGGDGSMFVDHETCFIFGDMNFRVNQHPKIAVQHIKQNRLEKLLQSDQLTIQMKKNISFPLRAFKESEIDFAPTYKFDVGTDTYDSSEKKRVPSWCDRIMYRGRLSSLWYDSRVTRLSDHRPVVGLFDVRVKHIDDDRYARVRKEVTLELT